MGGTVAVILKDHDGVITPMRRWTNIMPSYFSNLKLFSDDINLEKEWIASFLEIHNILSQDYEKNKDTGNFENNMTDTYFPWNVSAPYSYGLIVVDFVKKQIYSVQNYCRLANISAHQLLGSISSDLDATIENFDLGIKYKLFNHLVSNNSGTKIDLSDVTTNDLLELFSDMENRNSAFMNPKFFALNNEDKQMIAFSVDIILNTKWKVVENFHEDTAIDICLLKQALVKEGFIFTDEDNKMWLEHLEYPIENFQDTCNSQHTQEQIYSLLDETKLLTKLLKEEFNYDLVVSTPSLKTKNERKKKAKNT